jgi:branched-chain amino acid transport system ATP-binding protein
MADALRLDAVTVRYSGVTALREVSFKVGEGETVALIGPNGAGKTTLLNAVTRLISVASGEVEVLGARQRRLAAHKLRSIGVSRTFQHAHLIDDLTVLENVVSGGHLARDFGSLAMEAARFGRGRAARAGEVSRAIAVLEQLGLRDIHGELAGSLPFGRKKLVDLARSIVEPPRLLLLDEPTAGLVDGEVERLSEIIIEIGQSVPMLIVAHHMDFVAKVADRVICLDSGVKIAEGSVAAVRQDPAVVTAYLGDE